MYWQKTGVLWGTLYEMFRSEVSAGTANEVVYAQTLGIPVYTKFDDFVTAASADLKQPGYFNSCGS